ncbi:MAG TPA: ribonuclease P protein component [bacterium]|nr:ribonuclease P protein component [bacterium]
MLSKKEPWGRIIKQCRSIFNQELKIKFVKNNLNYNRYGIIVPIVVDKRAVVRNKIRRQIKNYLNQLNPKLSTGYDIIIFINEKIKGINYRQLKINLNYLFKKIKILSNFS